MKRGDTVYYTAQGGEGARIEARVERMHRDGSVTVYALWCVDERGEPILPGALGYRYRVDPVGLWSPSQKESLK